MGGTSSGVQPTPKNPKVTGVQRLDKKQVEQRIEEDRERHKRLRENIWAVPQDDVDAEFEKLWEETSDVGEDDYVLYEEEAQERKQASKDWAEEYKSKTSANGE